MALTLAAGTTPSPTKTDVVVVCDLNAYRRGRPESGEPCHVIGGGPIPVRHVRDAIDGDAFLKAITHDGVKIDTVAHFGRNLKTELRTALEVGAPPRFNGRECGCGKTHALQNDHINPLANGGPTAYNNLQPLAFAEHAEKTRQDRNAGLLRKRQRE